jgi:tetratricopeptide (TPR) repeat protein
MWEQRRAYIEQLKLKGDAAGVRDFSDVMLLWQEWLGEEGPRTSEVRDELTKLLGPRARSPWEFSSRAQALLRQGKVGLAVEQLEMARRLEPGDRWTNFLLGECAFKEKRFEQAVAAFSVCIGADSANPVYWFNRALAQGGAGQPMNALADLDQALRLDQHFAQALLERAVLRIRLRRFDGAMRDLQEARKAGSPAGSVCYQLALLALAQGNKAEARRQVQQALVAEPGHAEARRLQRRLER